MPSRREFIQHALAASALAAGPAAARTILAEEHGERCRFFKVLFDRTSAAGIAFGAEAVRRGLPALGVGADIGGVWMHEIEPRWKDGSGAIAGLTGGAPLFCLELLAHDYGMGVVYRAQHAPVAGGRVHHAIAGPQPLSAWEHRLAAAGDDWGTLAAALAVGCPETLAPDRRIGLVDLADRSGLAQRSLYSWVIAPLSRKPRPARTHYGLLKTPDRPQRG